MKKIAIISIFIFLTGIFTGIFFSTNLSADNNDYLSALLLNGITSPSAGFFRGLLSSLTVNIPLALLMMAPLLSPYLRPLPMILLCCKSFAMGFCSGLIFINSPDNAFSLSLLKLLPQNLLLTPAFLGLCIVTISYTIDSQKKKNRSFAGGKDLKYLLCLFMLMIVAGCIMESIFLQLPVGF